MQLHSRLIKITILKAETIHILVEGRFVSNIVMTSTLAWISTTCTDI